MIQKEIKKGNTIIRIHDDSVVPDPESILIRIGYLMAQVKKEKEGVKT
jgi:hypothetical protein